MNFQPYFLGPQLVGQRAGRAFSIVAGAFGLLAAGGDLHAQTFRIVPETPTLLRTVSVRRGRTVTTPENARIATRTDGSLGFIGAPADHHFLRTDIRFTTPQEAAVDFVSRTRSLLGVASTQVQLVPLPPRRGSRTAAIRFGQTYGGVPVYAAEVRVQVNDELGVDALLSTVMRRTQELDDGRLSLRPTLTSAKAADAARAGLARELAGEIPTVGPAELVLFDPELFDEAGSIRLAWQMNVTAGDGLRMDDEVFVDAHSGQLFDRVPNLHAALNRQIYDAGLQTVNPGTLVRTEGGAASSVPDANSAYTALGDVYSFYLNLHKRDGWDGAGGVFSSTCRYCTANLGATNCTYTGMTAAFRKGRMYYQPGSVTDDITGHEVTHGVTGSESGLKYKNQSGAINESFSDIWGEFIDLTNGRGDDRAAVRWLLGEDAPQWLGTGLRDLADPTVFSNPDRVGSPLYQPPSDKSDNGGVHNNSGVNNKLCFLLVDGQTFNGQIVTGMGVERVALLYYRAQTGLLTPTSGWTDLYNALQQAALDLNWTVAERNNLYRACRAVEIAAPDDVYVDKAKACLLADGIDDGCGTGAIPYLPFAGGPFPAVTQGNVAARPGDRLHIRAGSYSEKVVFNKRLSVVASGGAVVIGK